MSEIFKDKIEALYHPSKILNATYVPGIDRRLRPRSDLKVHLIWALKDHKPLLTGEIRDNLKEIFENTCAEMEVSILGEDLSTQHVHLFVSYPCHLSINEMVEKLKVKSSSRIFKSFPRLKNAYWERHLWGRGFFALSSGAINDEMIQNYLSSNEREESSPIGLKTASALP